LSRGVSKPLDSVWLCLFLFACKAEPGGKCDPGEARCLDANRELVCDNGIFVEVPCRGKGGCLTIQEATTCDISRNQAGDACGKSDEGAAICAGDKAMLACHSGKFERVACLGPRGCELSGDKANCDQSIGQAGDPCSKEGAKACSADLTRVLSCQLGRLAELYECRGEGRCAAEAGKLTCDQTVAQLGDRCDKGLNGHIACSPDKKSLLKCQNERFAASERCRPGTACTVSGQSTTCAKPEK
jgi:hypothetical protein